MELLKSLIFGAVWLLTLESVLTKNKVFFEETTLLPVHINCQKSDTYIEIGGVTLNAANIPANTEAYAKAECRRQLKGNSKKPGNNRTSCYLTFGEKLQKDPSGVIRVIYRCFKLEPNVVIPWRKKKTTAKVHTAEQKESGKNATLHCNKKNAMIIIKNSYINGVAANTNTHPSLHPDTLRLECYRQWASILSSKRYKRKQGTTCQIVNDKKNGGALQIDYVCTVAPETQKLEKA